MFLFARLFLALSDLRLIFNGTYTSHVTAFTKTLNDPTASDHVAGARVVVALIGIGGQAFLRNARAAHFEGFVLVISVALVMQGLLMLASGMGRSARARSL